MNQFVQDKSSGDLGSGFGNIRGKGLRLEFKWVNIKLTSSDPTKNGKVERRLVLVQYPLQDGSTGAANYITPEIAREQFPVEWDYFTKNGDMPINGTALGELPGISMSQVGILLVSGLRSVEDLVSLSDERASAIGIEAREAKKVAVAWMHKAKENAELIDYAARESASQAALEAERQKSAKAESMLQAMQARIDAMERMMSNGAQSNTSMQARPEGYDSGADLPDIEMTSTGEFDPLVD